MSFISKEKAVAAFPFAFRGNQEKAINDIVDALNRDDIKYVVVQAPTGAGKSPLAIAISSGTTAGDEEFTYGTYILTSNKLLQDQYLRDFSKDINDLRGRSNYKCLKYVGFNCAGSPCRASPGGRSDCGKQKACEYHAAVDDAKVGLITSMNFAASIAFFNYTPFFKPRQLLVVDEAHLIPGNLTNFIEFNVSAQQLMKMLPIEAGGSSTIPKYETAKEYQPWLEIISAYMAKREKDFVAPSNIDRLTGTEVTFEQIENFNRKIKTIIGEIQDYDNNLVVEHTFADTKQEIVDKISFKPVDVSRHAEDNLFCFGDKVLLMSATIINFEEFSKSLGIKPEESIFIDIPSTFPKENRPIIRNYVGTINKDNLSKLMPNITNSIREVLLNHSDQKGIIHTHTYQNAKSIVNALSSEFGNRLLFPENSMKQADILSQHKTSKLPTVLVSPSMTEGVDLKDDLSRFQVIMKVPYPYMGDKVVQARMKRNPNWYGYNTLLTLIQAYGRSTRSETDHSVTYILDGAFESLVSRYRKTLPKWFTEAIL